MHFAHVSSAQVVGLDARRIDVEVDITRGLHAFTIVGLAAKAVDESRDRIGAAIKNSGFQSPKHTNQKVTVSLAPAEVRKEGAGFDVPIAIAYLIACDALPAIDEKTVFIGELSLDGTIRPIRGVIQVAEYTAKAGCTRLFVPKENAREAALVPGVNIYGVRTLRELIDHLRGITLISPQRPTKITTPKTQLFPITFADIAGHATAKRALTIAAAGKHSIALYGPPGTGKTMLAQSLISLLPPL